MPIKTTAMVKMLLQREEIRATAVSAEEGAALQRLIAERRATVSLEVGLAYGVSALFICDAMIKTGGRRHIAIDPWQAEGFGGAGLRNLEEAGFGPILDFRQKKSAVALPELASEGTRIDFAFIDGFHTFDHVLLDFFYVDMLLNVGGVVVFDDAEWPAIHRVCRFIATNRAYRVCAEVGGSETGRKNRMLSWCAQRSGAVGRLLHPKLTLPDEELNFSPNSSLIAFEKLADDSRKWDFDHPF